MKGAGSRLPIISSRRRLAALLVLLAIALGVTPAIGSAPNQSVAEDLRVYLISIDSLGPDEVTREQTPFLHGLKETGFWFDSVGVPPATTVPNHVAMLTGVRGNRNGFVSNANLPPVDQKRGFRADHLFTRIEREHPDIYTALFSDGHGFDTLFGTRNENEDEGKRDQTGPDTNEFTADPFGDFLRWAIETPAPQFALVHDVKVDEVGHATPGASDPDNPETKLLEQAREARSGAILAADLRLSQLVAGLKARPDVWAETILVITSDHTMDFAPATRFIDPGPTLSDDECGAVPYDDGTQVLIDVVPCEDGETKEHFDGRVDAIAEALWKLETVRGRPGGVALVVSDRTAPSRADLGVDYLGDWEEDPHDILMFAKPGHTFLPVFSGNHGHPITQPNVLLVIGAHEALADPMSHRPQAKFEAPTETSFTSPLDRPSVLSIAPTAALLFRLDRDHFYEGKVLREAFDPGALN